MKLSYCSRNGFMAYVGSGNRPVLGVFHEIRCHYANIGTFIRKDSDHFKALNRFRKAFGIGVDHLICPLSRQLRRGHQPDFLECLSEGFLLFLWHIGQNIPHEMYLAAPP